MIRLLNLGTKALFYLNAFYYTILSMVVEYLLHLYQFFSLIFHFYGKKSIPVYQFL